MNSIKEHIINECIKFVKRDDVKDELKEIMKPVVKLIINELYPYVIFSISLIAIIFFMIVIIFIIQMQSFIPKIIIRKTT
jgi:hypothetical protein